MNTIGAFSALHLTDFLPHPFRTLHSALFHSASSVCLVFSHLCEGSINFSHSFECVICPLLKYSSILSAAAKKTQILTCASTEYIGLKITRMVLCFKAYSKTHFYK